MIHKKKILVYGVNYAPEITGIGKYSGEMAEWLAKRGHNVRVVTAPPYYPEWKVSKGYVNAYTTEEVEGVLVYRCPLYVPKKLSGLKRIIHLVSFAFCSFPVMMKQIFWKPDVVVVVEPPLFCAPTAWFVARLSGGKCWLHIQDFEVDAAFDLGIVPFSWMKRFVLALERWLMAKFDVVSTISRSMVKKLKGKGVESPEFFPNWASLSKIQFDQDKRNQFRESLNISLDDCLCLYSGNIAIKQGLDVLLDIAQDLPNYQFVICGDGANKAGLVLRAKDKGLRNIQFLPLQPLEKLSDMLSAADIHLVIQKEGAADLVLPSKLTNILAVGGVAIVTAEVNTELGQMAEGEQACVYRCDPENSSDLEVAIVHLNKTIKDRLRLGKSAQAYAEKHLNKNAILKEFENSLLILLSG